MLTNTLDGNLADNATDSTMTPELARAKPAPLDWQDPFRLESQLSDEERMIRDSDKSYCQDKLLSPRTSKETPTCQNWPVENGLAVLV